MILKTEHEDWAVHFMHVEDSRGCWTTQATVHKAPCMDEGRPCGTESIVGLAHCNPCDHFTKHIGRRIALTRALSVLDRQTRTEIWKAYWEIVG